MSGPHVKTPDSAATGQASEQITDSTIVADASFVDKRFATIAAQLALRGFALYRLDSGGFLIARWDRTSYSPDLHGVSLFLERIS